MLVGIALAVSMAAATSIAQQRQRSLPLPEGTSAIRGTLTDALTKAPITGCTVRANLLPTTPTAMRNATVTTAADGAYAFEGIADGDYYLLVECASYLTGCLANDDPRGRPCGNITVFKDQQRSNMDFRLTPASSVRGRVVDGSGKPVPRAVVRIGGAFAGNTVITYSLMPTTTNDDGTFEIAKIGAGSWYLMVEVPPVPGAYRSPIVYYPGVTERDAAGSVEVIGGMVTDNVIITVPPVLGSTLTVHIPPPDATMTEVVVSLVRASPLMTRRLEIDADGKAAITGLIEGRYLVTATALSGDQRWADYQPVNFQDSVDVALTPQPAGRIRGHVTGDRGLPSFENASIGAVWVEDSIPLNPTAPEEGTVAADGSFAIEGLFGRRTLELVRFDPNWKIHSVLYGRSDVTETGVDVAPGSTIDVTIVVRPR